MAVNGFDFKLDMFGELVINEINHEIDTVKSDDLKVQLAYTRIKSIANGWFYDNVGADLEALVGRPVKKEIVSVGTTKIIEVLTYDDLWAEEDILIQTTIKDSTHVIYSVYLRKYTDDEFGEESIVMNIELDLVQGVRIKFGW